MEAVKQNGLALEFVKEQTEEICFEAVPYPSSDTAVLNDLILQEEQEKLEARVK